MAAPMTQIRIRMLGKQFLQQKNLMSVAFQNKSGFCIHIYRKNNLFIHSGRQFPKSYISLSIHKPISRRIFQVQAKNMCTNNNSVNSKQAVYSDPFRKFLLTSSNCGPHGAFDASAVQHLYCRVATHQCFCRKYSSSNNKLDVKEIPASKRKETSFDTSKQNVKENIWTVPNLLTTLRLISAPLIGYLVVQDNLTWAFGLFVCAGLTDMLDGYIARNFKNQMSTLGTALDPLADKVLMFTLAITLATANLLPVPLATVIIGRDALLIAASLVVRYRSLPPPRTISRYFDVTNPTAEVHPSTLSKINTGLQITLISATLASPVFDFVDHPAVQLLWWVTGATTVASGIGYAVFWKSTVTILKKDKGK